MCWAQGFLTLWLSVVSFKEEVERHPRESGGGQESQVNFLLPLGCVPLLEATAPFQRSSSRCCHSCKPFHVRLAAPASPSRLEVGTPASAPASPSPSHPVYRRSGSSPTESAVFFSFLLVETLGAAQEEQCWDPTALLSLGLILHSLLQTSCQGMAQQPVVISITQVWFAHTCH